MYIAILTKNGDTVDHWFGDTMTATSDKARKMIHANKTAGFRSACYEIKDSTGLPWGNAFAAWKVVKCKNGHGFRVALDYDAPRK